MRLFLIFTLTIALAGCFALPPVSGSNGLTQSNLNKVIVGKTTQPQLESMLGRGNYRHPTSWTSTTHQLAFQVPTNAKHMLVYDQKPIAFGSVFGTNNRTRFAVLLDDRGVVIRKALIHR